MHPPAPSIDTYHKRSAVPAVHRVLIPSFHSRYSPEMQAIVKIMMHQPHLWDEVTQHYDTRFAVAVRERDNAAMIRILGEQAPYMLVCWMVVMASPVAAILIPMEP